MLINNLNECEEFIAADGAILRELLHPDKIAIALRYSLAHAIIKPGDTSYPHRLISSEVYYIIEGEGEMHINNETEKVHAGQAIYIPPHAIQFIHNPGRGDLVFICIVDPAWRAEDEEIIGR